MKVSLANKGVLTMQLYHSICTNISENKTLNFHKSTLEYYHPDVNVLQSTETIVSLSRMLHSDVQLTYVGLHFQFCLYCILFT